MILSNDKSYERSTFHDYIVVTVNFLVRTDTQRLEPEDFWEHRTGLRVNHHGVAHAHGWNSAVSNDAEIKHSAIL
jgi:hypothetical protein